jgi:hypothetical protein
MFSLMIVRSSLSSPERRSRAGRAVASESDPNRPRTPPGLAYLPASGCHLRRAFSCCGASSRRANGRFPPASAAQHRLPTRAQTFWTPGRPELHRRIGKRKSTARSDSISLAPGSARIQSFGYTTVNYFESENGQRAAVEIATHLDEEEAVQSGADYWGVEAC